MKTVHRVEFLVDDEHHVTIKGFLRGLAVKVSRRYPDTSLELWYEVDPDANDSVDVTIYCEGTGHPITHAGLYVGTVLDRHGLVWHVYIERAVTVVGAV